MFCSPTLADLTDLVDVSIIDLCGHQSYTVLENRVKYTIDIYDFRSGELVARLPYITTRCHAYTARGFFEYLKSKVKEKL